MKTRYYLTKCALCNHRERLRNNGYLWAYICSDCRDDQ